MSLSGRVVVPSLAKTPTRTGALVQRVEARSGSSQGAVIPALRFQTDASGQFSASAASSAVPAGTIAVVAVLQDGSELQGTVNHGAASDFVATRLFEQPWTVTENREGALRATLNRQLDGDSLQCTLALDWTLPSTAAQPLQLRIVRLLRVNGTVRNDAFFVRLLSYGGRVMTLADGSYASRNGSVSDPASTSTRTEQGMQRELSYLAPQRLESAYYDKRPTLYLEVQGLCGASETTQIRFDYAPR